MLTKLLADPKLRCGLRNKAVLGLIHLGPSAKAAVPTMLAVFADKNANFKAEIAVAAVIIDLEAAKPALIWLREHLRSNSNQDIEDTYDILECLPLAGQPCEDTGAGTDRALAIKGFGNPAARRARAPHHRAGRERHGHTVEGTGLQGSSGGYPPERRGCDRRHHPREPIEVTQKRLE